MIRTIQGGQLCNMTNSLFPSKEQINSCRPSLEPRKVRPHGRLGTVVRAAPECAKALYDVPGCGWG